MVRVGEQDCIICIKMDIISQCWNNMCKLQIVLDQAQNLMVPPLVTEREDDVRPSVQIVCVPYSSKGLLKGALQELLQSGLCVNQTLILAPVSACTFFLPSFQEPQLP